MVAAHLQYAADGGEYSISLAVIQSVVLLQPFKAPVEHFGGRVVSIRAGGIRQFEEIGEKVGCGLRAIAFQAYSPRLFGNAGGRQRCEHAETDSNRKQR